MSDLTQENLAPVEENLADVEQNEIVNDEVNEQVEIDPEQARIAELEAEKAKLDAQKKAARRAEALKSAQLDKLNAELAQLKAQNAEIITALQRTGQQYYAEPQQYASNPNVQIKDVVKEAITEAERAKVETERQQRLKQSMAKIENRFQESLADARDMYDDFDYRVQTAPAASNDLIKELKGVDNPGNVVNALAMPENHAFIHELNGLSDLEIRQRLKEFERNLNNTSNSTSENASNLAGIKFDDKSVVKPEKFKPIGNKGVAPKVGVRTQDGAFDLQATLKMLEENGIPVKR